MRLPTALTEHLYRCVWSVMKSRPSDVNIGRDDNDVPYMQRWHAIPRNKLFNVYLHLYHHDDAITLHSHPWWSISALLHGRLLEFSTPTAEGANDPEAHRGKFINPGDITIRSADMYHRLEIAGNRTITIFVTGPKFKTWYFACKRGLIHWKDFVSDRDKGEVGAGCGEDDHYPTTRA